MTVIISMLPDQVFDKKLDQFELYRFENIFNSEDIDLFFGTLENFLKRIDEHEYVIKMISNEKEGRIIDNTIEKISVNKMTFNFTEVAGLEVFYFSSQSEKWAIYCDSGIEWVIFGVNSNLKEVYKNHFCKPELETLKYQSVDDAVSIIHPIEREQDKWLEFIEKLKANYGNVSSC